VEHGYLQSLKAKEEQERKEREREREEKRLHSGGDIREKDDREREDTSAFPAVAKRVLFNGTVSIILSAALWAPQMLPSHFPSLRARGLSGTEGWVVCLMMKNFGIVRLAANSFEEIQEWTRFLLSPPTTNRRTSTVNGFLWIGTRLSLRCRHGWIRVTCGPYATASFCLPLFLLFYPLAGKVKENSWERFYCVSDGSKFEYYKIKNVVRPIFHLSLVVLLRLTNCPYCTAADAAGRLHQLSAYWNTGAGEPGDNHQSGYELACARGTRSLLLLGPHTVACSPTLANVAHRDR
jgi:hypothetical protein